MKKRSGQGRRRGKQPKALTVNQSGGAPLSPERRRKCVDHVRAIFGVSERRACRVLSQPRRTQRYQPKPNPQEDNLTAEIRMLSLKHPRYGYKRITALLKRSGWRVNRKRVHRIWRREGLKVPIRQRKKSRLWLEGARYALNPGAATTSGATTLPTSAPRMAGRSGS